MMAKKTPSDAYRSGWLQKKQLLAEERVNAA